MINVRFHRQVAEVAAHNGFQVLDLYDAFSYSGYQPRELVLARWNDHPNPLGHELAARAIVEKFLAERFYFFGTAANAPERTTPKTFHGKSVVGLSSSGRLHAPAARDATCSRPECAA